MKMSNIQMEQYVDMLDNPVYLNQRNIIGYAAARNIRFMKNAMIEYNTHKDELIKKYGEAEIGDDGTPTGRIGISIKSPNMKKYANEISEFAIIEHEVPIVMVPYESVIGKLTGSEILEIDWMLKDSEIAEEE